MGTIQLVRVMTLQKRHKMQWSSHLGKPEDLLSWNQHKKLIAITVSSLWYLYINIYIIIMQHNLASTSKMNQFQDLSQDFTRNIPTFRETSLLEEAGISKPGSSSEEEEDAFLFYSNDEVRMRALSGGTRGAAHRSAVTDGVARKTRISFELHPSVFFEDLFFEEQLPDEATANGIYEHTTEEGEDTTAAMAESPKMEGVVPILFGKDVQSNINTSRAA